MRTTAYWNGILITVVLGAGACGKSDEVELDDFGEQAARSTCDKVYECCMPTDKELVAHMRYSGGRAECGSKTRDSVGFWAAVISQEQDKGRLHYDAKLARRCLDAFAAATCETHKSNAALDGCDTFITPRTAPGAACSASESCMGGACVGVTAEKEGVCRAYVAEGASCADNPCSKDLICGSGKICRQRLPSGQSCNSHGECQSQGCNGLDADAGTRGTCGPKGGEQTRCFVTTGCSFAGGGSPAGSAPLVLVALGALVAALRRRR
jgi:MYXO-CTERM domain-containing protein